MKYYSLPVSLALLSVIALAACGGSASIASTPASSAPASSAAAKPSTAASAPSTAASTSAGAASVGASAKPAASTGGSAAASGGSAAAKPAPSIVPATTAATVKTAASSTLGTILVDGATGKTLYTFDGQTTDPLKCNVACLRPWPPFLSTTAPAAPAGFSPKLGLVTRTDVKVQQVTVDNMPLYFFIQDQAPGDTKGQGSKGFGGNWQVVKAG